MKFRLFVLVASVLVACDEKKDENAIDFSADLIDSNNLIKEIIDEIKENYADEIAREKLEIGAINGMLKVLDDHSTYITQDEFDAFNKSTRGAFLGIGIEIKQENDGIEIISIVDDSPASKAGLKVSDIITHIDNTDVLKMNMKMVITKLSSDYAMKIRVSVLRNKSDKLEFKLSKSVIQIQSVKLSFMDDIAVIKISHFNEGTLLAITKSIKELMKKKITGVIIDLRNNPGGILEQAVKVCDLFLANKKIVEFRSKRADDSKVVFADDVDLLDGLPMAVLIDSNTASGGELVAAALGENKRAVLLGERTYGKGSQQTIIPIPGRGAIKLTTSHFVSPNGNVIDHAGVQPDIEVPKNQTDPETSTAENNQTPVMLRAIDLLHGISALN
ncbi:MAG: S41 family peptidase [Holosporales bacterium]|jgi:carboxyl-terminal processing protease|nr:S41 family peptidase [Holosporales bacterium]